MTKIVFIGSGSVVFAKNLIADILWHPALAGASFTLVDIDPDRLETSRRMAELIRRDLGAQASTITATADRRRGLEGADFVISSIGVGGYEATRIDHELPARYGLRQTIGDTLGVGGIFRTLRGAPVLLDICREMEELCPGALLLNYSNPMATHCMAVARATRINAVGLCHGVVNTAQTMRLLVEMARLPEQAIWDHFQLPPESPERHRQWRQWWAQGEDPTVSYLCAGINHMAFFLNFKAGGVDLYPELRRMLSMPAMLRMDPVRFEVFRYFDFFMTEGSGHTAEYLPWFLKHPKEILDLHIGVSSYLQTCKRQDESYRQMREQIHSGAPMVEQPYKLSVEYASRIINAVVTGSSYVFNGNVINRAGALIHNLPDDCCVEVPCVADRNGVTAVSVGSLPTQCAALCRTNVNVQELMVEGLLNRDRRRITQAAMIDPNTSSQLTLKQIDGLVREMFDAQARWMPAGL